MYLKVELNDGQKVQMFGGGAGYYYISVIINFVLKIDQKPRSLVSQQSATKAGDKVFLQIPQAMYLTKN